MKRKKLLRKLYGSYILIILFALTAIGIVSSRSFRAFYVSEALHDLKARSMIITPRMSPTLLSNRDSVTTICDEISRLSDTRITLIQPDGKVVYDSDESPATMDNHGDRPEVIEALNRRVGSSIRYSHTLSEDMLYLAVPLKQGNFIYAVLRTSIPLSSIKPILRQFYLDILLVSIIVAILSFALFLLSSRNVSREIEMLVEGSRKFASGELNRPIALPDSTEMTQLAESLNLMAESLNKQINTITIQKNESAALFDSMLEGVIAVDNHNRIISINRAAAMMFSVIESEAIGRSIIEVIRHPDLHNSVATLLSDSSPIESEISLVDPLFTRNILIHGSPLIGDEAQRAGAVLVLNDVTKIRKLESSRRDFVANVSHELKTPITSISGFVETLMDGAIAKPDEADKFLKIIAKQTERLSSLVEDLLSLTRIEQNVEQKSVKLSAGSLNGVVKGAIQNSLATAEKKNIEVELRSLKPLIAVFNYQLLEQAITNLIVNAVQYSDPDSQVVVELKRDEGQIAISVTDHGCGISQEHIPRLFERFYRVDRGRSRDSGGTGLGLAIVKHIVLIHNGKITVSSQPGIGSTFSITLPT